MLNTRLDHLKDYPFQRLAALLQGLEPGQSPPSLLSLGEPQHPVPALVPRLLAARPEDWGRYPPTAGTPELRGAIADWLTRRYALPGGMIDPAHGVVPVSGTREALYMIGQVIFPERKQDRPPVVAMPNPFYQVYLGSAIMHGAEPLLVDATRTTGFLPDFTALPPETLERLAAVVLCSPANPQGAVATAAQWQALITLARRHDFVVIADECYSELYRHTPPPGALEACRDLGGSLEKVLVFNSLSKRSNVPGLRSGFVAGDPEILARFVRLRAYGGAGLPLPVQAVSAALWADEAHVADNRRLYAEKIDDATALLQGRFGYQPPEGGFFLWLDVGDGEAATRRLWQEAGVKVLPGAYLAQPGTDGSNCGAPYIRIALVQPRAVTAEALRRLVDLLS